VYPLQLAPFNIDVFASLALYKNPCFYLSKTK
jgi:hypothetical protein